MSDASDAISPENEPKPEGRKEKSAEEQKWFERYKTVPPYFSAFFAGLAFIISCIACFFVYRQSENSRISAKSAQQSAASAQKSVAIAEMAAKISNRAYVHAITAQINKKGKFPIIEIYVANNGQTPAYKVETIAMYAIDTIGCCPDTLIFENIKGLKGVGIIPQKSHVWSKIPIDNQWKISKLNQVLRGDEKMFLQVYGWITYNTIFAERCSTTYALCFNTNMNGFVVCPKNNDEYRIK